MGIEILKDYIPFINHDEKKPEDKPKDPPPSNIITTHVDKINDYLKDQQK